VNSESEKSAIPLLGGIAPLGLPDTRASPTLNLTYPQSFHTVGAMNVILSISIVALTSALIAALFVAVRVVSRSFDRPRAVAEPVAARWTDQDFADMSHRIDHLSEAVAEGITKVSRNENRIQKTVTSARRLVREAGLEHAGIEAEYEELQPRDAEAEQALPPLPEEVEATRTVRIPGGELTIGVA